MGRPEFVWLQNCESDCLISDFGEPQGTVLPRFLFTTYTSDFKYCTESCHLQKFSDYTAILGCAAGGDKTWSTMLLHGVRRTTCKRTQGMVVDFRKNKPVPSPVIIRGRSVGLVDTYHLPWCQARQQIRLVNPHRGHPQEGSELAVWADSGPSTSVKRCCGCFISLLWQAPSSSQYLTTGHQS